VHLQTRGTARRAPSERPILRGVSTRPGLAGVSVSCGRRSRAQGVHKPPTAFERFSDTMLPPEEPKPGIVGGADGATQRGIVRTRWVSQGLATLRRAVTAWSSRGCVRLSPGWQTNWSGPSLGRCKALADARRLRGHPAGPGGHPTSSAQALGARLPWQHVAQGRAGGSRDSRRVLTSAAGSTASSRRATLRRAPSDANDVMRTTIKETTVHDTRTGVAALMQPAHGIADARPPPTIRGYHRRLAGRSRRRSAGHQHRPQGACVRQRHPRTTDKDTLCSSSREQRRGGAGTGYSTAPRDVAHRNSSFRTARTQESPGTGGMLTR
jgi:hypothetical protein